MAGEGYLTICVQKQLQVHGLQLSAKATVQNLARGMQLVLASLLCSTVTWYVCIIIIHVDEIDNVQIQLTRLFNKREE